MTGDEADVSSSSAWLDAHVARAPEALRARVQSYAGAAPPGETTAESLAIAGQAALDYVLAHPGDRSVALDLLAADALVTLALLAEAQHQPGHLGAFAAGLLQSHLPRS